MQLSQSDAEVGVQSKSQSAAVLISLQTDLQNVTLQTKARLIHRSIFKGVWGRSETLWKPSFRGFKTLWKPFWNALKHFETL